MQEYCLYVFISSFIISICILPILLYLSKNKLKFKPKSIYNIYFAICIVLFVPLININFSRGEWGKDIQNNASNNIENSYYIADLEEAPLLGESDSIKDTSNIEDSKVSELKIENSKIKETEMLEESKIKEAQIIEESKIIETGMAEEKNEYSINIKNNIAYWIYNLSPKLWGIIAILILVYYFVIYKIYILKLDLIE